MGRQVLAVGALVVVILVPSSIYTYRQVEEGETGRVTEGLAAVVQTLATRISIEDHLTVSQSGRESSPAFTRIATVLLGAARSNGLRDDQLYTFFIRSDGTLSFAVMLHPTPFVGQNYHVPQALRPTVDASLRTGDTGRTGRFSDSHGTFVSAFAPLVDDQGEVQGLVWADRDYDELRPAVRSRFLRLLTLELLVAVVLMAAVLATRQRVSQRLRALLIRLRVAFEGEKGEDRPSLESRDEIAELESLIDDFSNAVRVHQRLRTYLPPRSQLYAQRDSGNAVCESERLTAVVMFTDVRGFAELSERVTPEALTLITNNALRSQIDIVRNTGGSVEKLMGDGLMAVFEGADAPGRSLLAAARIIPTVGSLRFPEEDVNAIQVGVGMSFGEVVVGTVGNDAYRERAVLGAQVNLASRLCSVAEPREIVISAALFEQVRARVPEARQRSVRLKGISNVLAFTVEVGSGGVEES